jgi:hypothetical protein
MMAKPLLPKYKPLSCKHYKELETAIRKAEERVNRDEFIRQGISLERFQMQCYDIAESLYFEDGFKKELWRCGYHTWDIWRAHSLITPSIYPSNTKPPVFRWLILRLQLRAIWTYYWFKGLLRITLYSFGNTIRRLQK